MTSRPLVDAVDHAYSAIRDVLTAGPIGADSLAEILRTMQALRAEIEIDAAAEGDRAFGRGFRLGYTNGHRDGLTEGEASAQTEIATRDLEIAELRLRLTGTTVDLRDTDATPDPAPTRPH